MESKYLEYKDEIVSLFWNGNGYQAIAQHLIDKYHFKVKKYTLKIDGKPTYVYASKFLSLKDAKKDINNRFGDSKITNIKEV